MLCFLPWLLLSAGGSETTAQKEPCTDFLDAVSSATPNPNIADRHTTAVTSLLSLVHRLAWTDVILVSDEDGELWGGSDRLLTSNSTDFRKIVVFHSSVAWQPHGLPALVMPGPGGAIQSLDIIVVCNMTCVTSVLNGAREFENRWKSQTALRERSRWLVHPTDVSNPRWLDLSNVTMNNVAVLVLERPSDPAFSLGDFNVKASLYTLRWTSQGRQLDIVEEQHGAGFTAAATSVFPNLQLGLNGKLLLVGMNPTVTFTMQKMDNGTTVYDGYYMDLLLLLSEYLNFTYEIVQPEDGSWGIPMNNGSWTGLLGMLQRREIDTSLIFFHQTLTRSMVVDFSTPLEYDALTFMYRKPGPRSFGFLTYFKPFSLGVIGCIFLATLLTAVLMTALDLSLNTEDVETSSMSEVRRKSRFGHFLDRLHFTSWALLLNGQEKNETRSCSGRMTVTCWWLFCVVMAAAYTGNLVAFLAVPQEAFPISSLEDLVSQTKYKWGTIGSAVIHHNLKEANNSLFRKLWQGIEEFSREDPAVLSPKDRVHVGKVLHEDYIMLVTTVMAKDWLYRHCELELAVQSMSFGAGSSSIVFQKGSVYEPMFSSKVYKLRESGLWEIMKRKWRMRFEDPSCASSPSTGEHTAALEDVQGAFYVLVAGVATAGTTLMGELLTKYVRTRWKRKEES